MPTVQMRDAVADDEPFLLELYNAGRIRELKAIEWDELQIAAFGPLD